MILSIFDQSTRISSSVVLKFISWAHDINFKTTELDIRVDWSNMDKITGHNNIKIKRPKQL